MLDVWPALPLVIRGYVSRPVMDNIIAVLERSDRVFSIDLHYDDSGSQLEKVPAMQEPFPELAHLKMICTNAEQVVPDSFLGGSAPPRLGFLQLHAFPFPGLPKLLLSTIHLVALYLSDIPHSGYFSPEAIVSGLSRTASLKTLSLGFRYLHSRPDPENRRQLPLIRTVLPALTYFDFEEGASEYLEDLVARIDAPRLNHLDITLSGDQFDFDTPQLVQFISRTPTLKAHDEAHVVIDDGAVKTILLSRKAGSVLALLNINFLFRESGFQLASLPWVSTSSSPSLSMVESLYIYRNPMRLYWEDEILIENTEWLDLLRPYTAAKDLYLSEVFGPGIVRALQGSVAGRRTVVLPTLRTVFLEGLQPLGPVPEDIGQFVVARQISGSPCTVSLWNGAGRF